MEMVYGSTLYEKEGLINTAKAFLEKLPGSVNTLASTGTSGCAIATAMIVLADRPLQHVSIRKEGESQHKVFYTGEFAEGNICIVDDFIGSGDSIVRVLRKIDSYHWNARTIYVIVTGMEVEKNFLNKFRRALNVKKDVLKGVLITDYRKQEF